MSSPPRTNEKTSAELQSHPIENFLATVLWLRHSLQDRIISLLQVMHTVKYTKVEPSYKNYHIDIYFETKTIVAHAAKCWTQWHVFTSIQFSHTQLCR